MLQVGHQPFRGKLQLTVLQEVYLQLLEAREVMGTL
jgi:hypothetical protein